MRALAAALAVLLLVAISSVAGGNLGSPAIAAKMQETIPICCTTYISRPIPVRLIHSAYRTSNSCPNPAVVLVTRKGRNLCVDPKAPWVQKYLVYSELQEH